LRVAAGERLPMTQNEILRRGHAIEVRLYAENPDRNFLPATGTLHGLRFPAIDGAVRVDTGVREGDAVTPFYDPMIAKIIAWGEDRDAARIRLARALDETAVLGVTTNLAFLRRVVGNADFATGAVDTGFIERHRDILVPPAKPIADMTLAAAALHRLAAAAATVADRGSPWGRTDGWRLNSASAPRDVVLRILDETIAVQATADGGNWALQIADRRYRARAEPTATGSFALTLDGARRTAFMLEHDETLSVTIDGETWRLDVVDPLAPPAGADLAAGRLTAPMPGRVVQVQVAAGDVVRQGQALMVVEAMKMEHTIAAPRDGVVETVRYGVGDLVEEGTELIALTDAAGGKRG
jgi:3-methylcrotonyl-CoA carboxylase alpha subunit